MSQTNTEGPVDLNEPGIAEDEVTVDSIPAHRESYLCDVLGLPYDPFKNPVAEQEVQDYPQDFFSFFIDFQNGLIEKLLLRKHSAVFGRPGSGKTTLRLNLEYEARCRSNSPLTVTCDLGAGVPDDPGLYVARQMAKAIFVQSLERFNAIYPEQVHNPETLDGLSRIWLPRFSRVARLILERKDNAPIQDLWHRLDSQPIKPIPSSTQMRLFVEKLLDAAPCTSRNAPQVLDAVDVAEELEFDRVFIMVDGLDAVERSRDAMFALLEPFLEIANRYPSTINLKLFLPMEVRELLVPALGALQPTVSTTESVIDVVWTRDTLQRLFHERFRALGREDIERLEDLFDWKGTERPAAIDWQLIGDLPRDLMRSVSAVIDVHAASSRHGEPFMLPTNLNIMATERVGSLNNR